MVRNEQTSKQVASYAAEILAMDKPPGVSIELWSKIKSVAASALTQTPNKPLSMAEHLAAMAVVNKQIEDAKAARNVAIYKKMFNKG
ncbi:hypothetical protein FPZ42_07735 [Mucilaginibacter achroorhodeus]|uniref:Uncharacterized protein n=1 Tax=Mucilaginibacter achroorhodeus TaxID=2599294 RepID=A0A563U6D8_9SPHI|nr:hypothetical protein [Mucilaginibacter achroorhodeus]TWR26917.1 hypothetical protein FPZ42_07735 [Mucilaginibacter achroorhodeus]